MDDNFSNLSFRSLITRLASQASVYGFGEILVKATRFLLLPLYLRYMTPADYGLLALANIIPAFLVGILTLLVESSVTRFYYEWEKEDKTRLALTSIWIPSLLWSGLVIFVTVSFGDPLFGGLFEQVPFDPYMRLAILTAGTAALTAIPRKLLRMREQLNALQLKQCAKG